MKDISNGYDSLHVEQASLGNNKVVSSAYDPVDDPFSSEFVNSKSNMVCIPLTNIRKISQSRLYYVVTAVGYRFATSETRFLFDHCLLDDSGKGNAEAVATCERIVFLNTSIGKIKMADGLLTICSIDHPVVKSNSITCDVFRERGDSACHECHRSWSDNEDLEDEAVNSCPYRSYFSFPEDDSCEDDE